MNFIQNLETNIQDLQQLQAIEDHNLESLRKLQTQIQAQVDSFLSKLNTYSGQNIQQIPLNDLSQDFSALHQQISQINAYYQDVQTQLAQVQQAENKVYTCLAALEFAIEHCIQHIKTEYQQFLQIQTSQMTPTKKIQAYQQDFFSLLTQRNQVKVPNRKLAQYHKAIQNLQKQSQLLAQLQSTEAQILAAPQTSKDFDNPDTENALSTYFQTQFAKANTTPNLSRSCLPKPGTSQHKPFPGKAQLYLLTISVVLAGLYRTFHTSSPQCDPPSQAIKKPKPAKQVHTLTEGTLYHVKNYTYSGTADLVQVIKFLEAHNFEFHSHKIYKFIGEHVYHFQLKRVPNTNAHEINILHRISPGSKTTSIKHIPQKARLEIFMPSS